MSDPLEILKACLEKEKSLTKLRENARDNGPEISRVLNLSVKLLHFKLNVVVLFNIPIMKTILFSGSDMTTED